jgi:hypothetical protein
MKKDTKKETLAEKFEALRKLLGPVWDNVICPCREMLKEGCLFM